MNISSDALAKSSFKEPIQKFVTMLDAEAFLPSEANEASVDKYEEMKQAPHIKSNATVICESRPRP